MSKFDVKRGDLTVDARFAAPAFGLLRPESARLLEVLLTRLAAYGASADTVFYNREGPLGTQNVTINTPSVNGGVKIFVSRVEAGFNDLAAIQFAHIEGVIKALFESITPVIPAPGGYAAYVVSLNYHGLVEGKTHAEFLRQFTPGGPDLGPLNGTAAGFYYGPKDQRMNLSIVMDSSLAVPNGLYVRITAAFDGRLLSPGELPKAGANMLAEVLAAFGLEHKLALGK